MADLLKQGEFVPEKENELGELINRDRGEKKDRWQGTVWNFLQMIMGGGYDPQAVQSAAARMYSIIKSEGTEDVSPSLGLKKEVKRHKFFGKLRGIEPSIHDLVSAIKAAADGSAVGKRFIVFVGPTSTGKSTIVSLMAEGLEKKGCFYVIKGCHKNCHPLRIIPRHLREEFRTKYSIPVPLEKNADICFECRQNLTEEVKIKELQEKLETVRELKRKEAYVVQGKIFWEKVTDLYGEEESTELREVETFFDEDGKINWSRAYRRFNYRNEKGDILWERMPVIEQTFSRRACRGISSFEPGDSKSQDIMALVGRKDSAKAGIYGEDDARAYNMREGVLPASDQGMFEGREIFLTDPSIMRAFISVCEEKEFKPQDGGFPHIYLDTVLIGHINIPGFLKFWGNEDNRALHSRIRVIAVPFNLRLSEEQIIYRQLLDEVKRKNPLFKDIHDDPYVLEALAKFALHTRMKPSKLCPDPDKKMRYLDGQNVIEEDKEPLDIDELRKEGFDEKDITKSEGMKGADVRFIQDALEVAFAQYGSKGCVFAVEALESLKAQFDRSMLFTPEEKGTYKAMIDKNVRPWLNREIKKDVTTAFIYGYGDIRQVIFRNYFRELIAWRDKKLVWDDDLQAKRPHSEQKLREIEEACGVSKSSEKQFRTEILSRMAGFEGGEIDIDSFPTLAKGIDAKLEKNLGDTAQYAIADEDPKDPKIKKRREDALAALVAKVKRPRCSVCAAHDLRYYDKIRQEEKE